MNILKNRKKAKGFTLIELIIVIAIIGILALIIIPQVMGYTNKARNGTDVADAKTLLSAIDTYNAEQQSKATTGTLIDESTSNTTTLASLATATATGGSTPDATISSTLSSINSADSSLYAETVGDLQGIVNGTILVHK